ncbi:hypothetical protein R3P38DRAFT_3257745 [Favolaschia claudopus]|uniref:Uncharacterized protein n=1 Tax=Favolaschia claudopus TaxID=2862362 RepID=A0AAW0D609_9AGAR
MLPNSYFQLKSSADYLDGTSSDPFETPPLPILPPPSQLERRRPSETRIGHLPAGFHDSLPAAPHTTFHPPLPRPHSSSGGTYNENYTKFPSTAVAGESFESHSPSNYLNISNSYPQELNNSYGVDIPSDNSSTSSSPHIFSQNLDCVFNERPGSSHSDYSFSQPPYYHGLPTQSHVDYHANTFLHSPSSHDPNNYLPSLPAFTWNAGDPSWRHPSPTDSFFETTSEAMTQDETE